MRLREVNRVIPKRPKARLKAGDEIFGGNIFAQKRDTT
jgi:hypothetical protein